MIPGLIEIVLNRDQEDILSADNAPIESFWEVLKNELIHHRRFVSKQEAMQEITGYIETLYNRQRRRKRLGYLSPLPSRKNFSENRGLNNQVWCRQLTTDLRVS
jgi:transposase InsO family protein